MVIAEVVQDLLNEKDFARNIELLRSRNREAILHLLSILNGTTDYQLEKGVHPVDSRDTALGAISALGRNDIGFLIELLNAALDSGESEPAYSLAWTLAYSEKREAVEPLMKAMKHKSESVRWAACTGLHRFRAKRARPLLNAAAADRSSFVRGCAVDALKSLGNESSLAVLEKRLHDRYPGIRSAAERAIEAIRRRAAS